VGKKPDGKYQNNMKALLALLIVVTALPANAGILAGPVVNPDNGHAYYLLSKNTWSNAEAEAVSLGGHLTTIRNAGEQQWVFSTFGPYGGALWIGLTDRDRVLTFTWTSGEPLLYTNWSSGQPDHGTGGIEYYTHMWPMGVDGPPPGEWNDYADVDDLWGFPLYGVAEIFQASTARLALHAPSNESDEEAAASQPVAAATRELRALTAIELCWASETNKHYCLQWTSSLDQPNWVNLGPLVSGTGANVSVFDSTREHPQGYYRVKIVQ